MTAIAISREKQINLIVPPHRQSIISIARGFILHVWRHCCEIFLSFSTSPMDLSLCLTRYAILSFLNPFEGDRRALPDQLCHWQLTLDSARPCTTHAPMTAITPQWAMTLDCRSSKAIKIVWRLSTFCRALCYVECCYLVGPTYEQVRNGDATWYEPLMTFKIWTSEICFNVRLFCFQKSVLCCTPLGI